MYPTQIQRYPPSVCIRFSLTGTIGVAKCLILSVCDPSADITFKSSDNVLFKIHSKYLEATSAGFTPPSPVAMNQEAVLLDEPSDVLEILFRFIHPPSEAQQYRQPTMLGVKSEILFGVAEAAEKYLVFGAMNICLSRMECAFSPGIRSAADLLFLVKPLKYIHSKF